jgi:FlaA1/EpsC-like NDP-sugar epimerase
VTATSPTRAERAHRWVWALADASIWVVAIYGACWLRYDFNENPVFVPGTMMVAIVAVVAHIGLGAIIGPYAVGHDRGSFEETIDITQTVAVTALGLFAIVLFVHPVLIPRSIPIMAGALALTGMFAVRFVVRTWCNWRSATTEGQRRVIIFGAGEAGRHLVRNMIRDPNSGFAPVAILDDDRVRGRLTVDGVHVRGTRHAMRGVAERYDATTLVIALPTADASVIRDLTERADDAGLDVLTLPPLRDIIGGSPTSSDLRDVDLRDLLGRRPVDLDTTVIAEQIAGKRILVTGAGGSIGSELCRQISRFGPGKLYLLDRDESGLQSAQMTLTGDGLLDNDEVVLADIRDLETLREVFRDTRPDMVFHAAALKHLPLLEAYPLEAWKTNVLGTLNVLTAAAESGVGTFVNISTDKAANPTCVLGYSKRLAERLTADVDHRQHGRYVSVRFGNVLGSRGSVVPAFTAQIERGGPVTVTHPDVERFFMLIPEACQLVLEAASIGMGGEVMVLDMGEQVRIVDVANTLIRMSGRRDIDIRYTGLRPGEKLGEELFAPHEDRRPTAHELVSSVDVPTLAHADVRSLAFHTHHGVAAWMRQQSQVSTALGLTHDMPPAKT